MCRTLVSRLSHAHDFKLLFLLSFRFVASVSFGNLCACSEGDDVNDGFKMAGKA